MDEKQIKAIKIIKTNLKRLKPRTKKDKNAVEYMLVMAEYLLTGDIGE